jgi:DNA-directed RNA polymerase subunit RPC12/RpoP
MSRDQEDDWRYSQEARERDYKIIWKCPSGCGEEYQDYPGTNEALPCPECGTRMVQSGESYR